MRRQIICRYIFNRHHTIRRIARTHASPSFCGCLMAGKQLARRRIL